MVRLQDHILVGVLDRPVERPEHGARRHVGIELLRHADADRDLNLGMLDLDLWPRRDQVFPRRRPVGHADLGPNALEVVAWIGHVVVAEADPLARDRIVRRALAQVDDRPVRPLGVAYHVGHVEHLRLERARRRQKLKEVVTLLSRDLGVGACRQVRQGDVVHRNLDTLLRAPVLRVLVEPGVVRGDEVAPLHDLERLLRALDQDGRTERDRRCGGAGRGDELPPIHPFPPGHGFTLHVMECGEEESGVGSQGLTPDSQLLNPFRSNTARSGRPGRLSASRLPRHTSC